MTTKTIFRSRLQSRQRRGEKGGAMIELALGSTLLLFLLIGSLDYGPIFYNVIELDAGARAGAIYGSQSVAHAADPAGMRQVALNNIINLSNVTATASETCLCPDSPSTEVDCATSCPNNGLIMVYATVTTQWTYTPVFQYPMVAYPLIFTRNATMRAQ
ncbi:MAG: TadE/TadG family type IV pilus assembly protein [Bryobacteraceae bacterium]